MKKKKTIQNVFLVGICLIFYSTTLYGQNGQGLLWKKNLQTNDIYKNQEFGNVGIGTSLPLEKLHIIGNMKVEGQIFSDSLKVNHNIETDFLRVHKLLMVGDSTLYSESNITDFITGQDNERILSSNGRITFGGTNTGTLSPKLYTSNIRVGIGAQTPQNQLHLHRDVIGSNQVYAQFTNATTNATINDGFHVGIGALGAAFLIQREDLPITFTVKNSVSGNQIERLKIYGSLDDNNAIISKGLVRIGETNGVGGINNTVLTGNSGSLAQLVVGGSQSLDLRNHVVAEFRNSFPASSSTGINIRGSRASYSNNMPSSIINFTNYNISMNKEQMLARIASGVQDNLNLNMGYLTLSTANNIGVLEQKIYISSEGRVGIATGLFQGVTASEIPARRLEVVDNNTNNSYLPQFRLTQKYNRFDVNSTYTDLGTNATGDFIIQPLFGNGTLLDTRNVGINTTTPQNTLDIFAKNNNESGLRFSRLTNSIMPTDDNYKGVLSVDAQGNVILVEDKEGTSGLVSADNGLTLSTPSNVQLGGDLIKTTDIALQNNILSIDGNAGRFNSGGLVG